MMLSWISIFVLFIVLNIYLVIGMLVFHFLEAEKENDVLLDTQDYKASILSNYSCLTEESLHKLIRKILYAVENGVNPANASTPSNWDYYQTFFFSGTIITTIGYGHVTPNTQLGQSFSVIYAIIGIPLTGILLSALANKFSGFKDRILQKAYEKLQKKWQQKAFSLIIINGCGMVLFIFVPTAIFSVVEGWPYHDSLYFCFITLTTVGFGDYVPGQNPEIIYPSIYKAVCLYGILLGLVYLAVIIQDVSDCFTKEVEKFDEKSSKVKTKAHQVGAALGHNILQVGAVLEHDILQVGAALKHEVHGDKQTEEKTDQL